MTLKNKWINACKRILHEYEHNNHNFSLSSCALCKIVDRDNPELKDTVQCIFGSCCFSGDGMFPCVSMKTFPRHPSIYLRIAFYKALIPRLEMVHSSMFYAKNIHHVAELCHQIDDMVYEQSLLQ